MRKVNYYYLIAGFLAILFSITHELHGQYTTIPALYLGKLDIGVLVTLNYIWHIITAENFVFGIAFIIMAFYKEIKNVSFAAWLICAILISRLFVIAGTTLVMFEGQPIDLIVDGVVLVIYTVIILLGTREKKDSKLFDIK